MIALACCNSARPPAPAVDIREAADVWPEMIGRAKISIELAVRLDPEATYTPPRIDEPR